MRTRLPMPVFEVVEQALMSRPPSAGALRPCIASLRWPGPAREPIGKSSSALAYKRTILAG
jgi:hypothetical protein